LYNHKSNARKARRINGFKVQVLSIMFHFISFHFHTLERYSTSGSLDVLFTVLPATLSGAGRSR